MNQKAQILAEGNWNSYKFRASQLGKIMSKPKGKSPLEKYNEAVAKQTELESDVATIIKKMSNREKILKTEENKIIKYSDLTYSISKLKDTLSYPWLSDTAKTYLAQIYVQEIYGREDDIMNKYMQKGLMLEEDAITQHSILTGKFFKKNTIRKNNDFVEGEFDYEDEEEDTIIDAKCSWSIFQFYKTVVKPLDPIYVWQMKSYLWLTGRKNGLVIHSLLDTPESILAAEMQKMKYNFTSSQSDFEQACLELKNNHTYIDIPKEEKESTKIVNLTEEDVIAMQTQINHARNYLNNFKNLKNKTYVTEEMDE